MEDRNSFIDEVVAAALCNRLRHYYQSESWKGCSGKVFPEPVDIRPPFLHFEADKFDKNINLSVEEMIKPRQQASFETATLRLWLNRKDNYGTEKTERFIKLLAGLERPVYFEIWGNSGGISVSLSIDIEKADILKNIVASTFPLAEIERIKPDFCKNILKENYAMILRDFYPSPPYFRNLTTFADIHDNSPLEPVFEALNTLEACEMGIYRVVISPFPREENWHRNIESLINCELMANGNGSLMLYREDQSDSFLSFGKTKRVGEEKANPDKPFIAAKIFFCAFVKSERCQKTAGMLEMFSHNFRYGGMPLNILTESDYIKAIGSKEMLAEAIASRHNHTQGMILNSLEATGFINFPEPMFSRRNYNVRIADGIKAPEEMKVGRVYLGDSIYGHEKGKIFLCDGASQRHVHIVGKIGYGKSNLLENLILDDVINGNGLCVIDPHGDLIDSILVKIPESEASRVIYFDPTIKDAYPCFNPFNVGNRNIDISMLCENFVYAFKKLFSNWGDRMERILRNVFFLLLQSRELALADLPILLSRTSQGEERRSQITDAIDNALVKGFWEDEFSHLGLQAIEPIHNKISKLLTNNYLGRTFSSRENLFVLSEKMDESRILLVKLPTGTMGIDGADVLGSILVSLFHQEAIRRADKPMEKRVPFSLYIDEFHRFSGREIEDFIVDERKYKVGVILAHQQRSQLPEDIDRILGNAYVLVALHNDFQEARALVREFPFEIEPEVILRLEVGEAFLKIGSRVAKVRLKPPTLPIKDNCGESIIESSIRQYYRRIDKSIEISEQKKNFTLPSNPGGKGRKRHDDKLFTLITECNHVYD